MPRQTEIILERKHLEDPEPDSGLTGDDLKFVDNHHQVRVKVLIDGALAEITEAKAGFIKVKTPPAGDGPWTLVVTTHDNKILDLLELEYDPKNETFSVKKQEAISDPARN
jgi:hypothetical protein